MTKPGESFDVTQVPLSMVTETNGTLYVSGHIAIEPDGTLCTGGVEEQTDRIFTNIKAVLAEKSVRMEDIVKVTVFLIDPKKNFPAMNAAYAKHFPFRPLPARSTIGVDLAVDQLIEIEAIAVRGHGDTVTAL